MTNRHLIESINRRSQSARNIGTIEIFIINDIFFSWKKTALIKHPCSWFIAFSPTHTLMDWWQVWLKRFISIRSLLPTRTLLVTASINQPLLRTLWGSVPTQRRPVGSDQYHCCSPPLPTVTSDLCGQLALSGCFPACSRFLPPLFCFKRHSLRKCHESPDRR